MKIVVDEMPKEPCECLFAIRGNYDPDIWGINENYRNCMINDDCACILNYGGRCEKLIAFQDLIIKKE